MFLIFFIKTFDKIEANEVACESVQDRFWYNSPVGTVKTCFMEDTTSINQRGFTILSSDDSVQGLRFTGNEKILFLPVQVGANFPNLLAYAARGCSIKIITKTNFEGLSKLRSLFLWYNEIEKISSDTFKDLKDLELLWLGKKNATCLMIFNFSTNFLRQQQNKIHQWRNFPWFEQT